MTQLIVKCSPITTTLALAHDTNYCDSESKAVHPRMIQVCQQPSICCFNVMTAKHGNVDMKTGYFHDYMRRGVYKGGLRGLEHPP